jgi:hypothetical protein
MPDTKNLTLLCLASYEKGSEFLREAKRQGCRVLLLTSHSLRDAGWPRESIDDIFFIPDQDKRWRREDVILGVSHLASNTVIHRIVPLDDFGLETAAALREHLRMTSPIWSQRFADPGEHPSAEITRSAMGRLTAEARCAAATRSSAGPTTPSIRHQDFYAFPAVSGNSLAESTRQAKRFRFVTSNSRR